MGITAKGYYKIRKRIVSKYILIKLKKKEICFMKKLLLFLLILLCSVNVFSDPIVSGLGVFYKTPYEEALTQLKKEGFEIDEIKNFKDESKDEIMISTVPFTFENMNFN